MLMDSSFFLATVVAATGFFTLLSILLFSVSKRFRFHPETEDLDSSSSPPSSSLSYKWTHDVFPSFRGEDVRRNFLSHFQKEFKRRGIIPFVDNDIKRGESIAPELIHAIQRSKVAVVLLSRNYASSKWCLDELVEIMRCKKELGQTVFVVFYQVDPSQVKKLTGDFGVVFEKTCKGKTKEDIRRWRQAFAQVATIAGYDSTTWVTEAVMIEEIVNEISKRLIYSTPSSGFEGLIGVAAHMEKLKLLLCLGSDEVRMIGIWGPPGIGKTTIARVAYDQFSSGFPLSVFMDIQSSYAKPTCSDDHNVKLHLQQQLLSQLTNQKDLQISHLGGAQNFLEGKKVLVVLDGVDHLVQLLAMPKARCLGPGTRIIVTTQNQKLLKAFQIEHVYKVDLPPSDEALQIFCISAFDQNSPYDGFENLAREVTKLAGSLPLGLRVMGSHLRGMSKEEWRGELPRLRIRLDGEIESILKLSYDALGEEDRDLFLHIACIFAKEDLDDDFFEDFLRHRFSNVHQGLKVLVQRSLMFNYRYNRYYKMHGLLVQLGKEIVRKQSIYEPGKRQFLFDASEICEVLTHNTGSTSVIGINFEFTKNMAVQNISERAFERMTNLQFLNFRRVYGEYKFDSPCSPQGLSYLSSKLRLLRWDNCPMTCLPSKFSPEFLVKIVMKNSKLEKLWDGIQPVRNLKLLNLNYSEHLKELPDLSTATNLQTPRLINCKSLLELPSSIWNVTNLHRLTLKGCSSLVKLPSSIGDATDLQILNLHGCSSLVELPSSIGDAINLQELNFESCSSLVELPSSIGNLTNLKKLSMRNLSSLVELPSFIGNLTNLQTLVVSECSRIVELPSFIGNLTNLQKLEVRNWSSLVELPSSIGKIINLSELYLLRCSSLVELPSSIGNLTNLRKLNLYGCSSLVELPSSIGNLTDLRKLNLYGCSSLVELPSFIGNLTNLRELNLSGCSSLVKVTSSIGNLVNLRNLVLDGCSSLVKIPSSIGNLQMLEWFSLQRCTKLEVLPININLPSLEELDFSGCSRLTSFPEISTNIEDLRLCGTLIKDVPLSIKSWSKLKELSIPYCKGLEEIPNALDIIRELEFNDTEIEEIPPWVSGISHLDRLVLNKCRKLRSIPQLPDSLGALVATDCDSLESVNLIPKSLFYSFNSTLKVYLYKGF